MFYHEQDQLQPRPASIKILSLWILDPTLKPEMPKPLEEDIQDAKLLYFWSPESSTIHTKRNLVGLSEGLLVFLGSFSTGTSKHIEVDWEGASLGVRIVEDNLLFCVLAEQHGSEDSSDWQKDWANKLIERLHSHWKMFYGMMKGWRAENGKMKEVFEQTMDHFIGQFIELSANGDEEGGICPQKLRMQGLDRFGLQKTQFVMTVQLESILRAEQKESYVFGWCLFYKNFYIYGDLEYSETVMLREYLFGLGKFPKHTTFIEKFTDFRKCRLEVSEALKSCKYGLINLAKESKDTLMGEIWEGPVKEEFTPTIYFPKRKKLPVFTRNSQTSALDEVNKEEEENKTNGDNEAEGEFALSKTEKIDEFELRLLKVGNFFLPILSKPGQKGIGEWFTALKPQVRQLLEHCERLILNQISLVETAVGKRAQVNALIYNQVNRSVIYYPFNRFSLAMLPPEMACKVMDLFEKSETSGVMDLELGMEGWHTTLTKWNSRVLLITSEDKKSSAKEYTEKVNSFRQGLSDIFI